MKQLLRLRAQQDESWSASARRVRFFDNDRRVYRIVLKLMAVLLVASGVSGCVTYSNLESDTDFKMGADEGIVVIGVPSNAGVRIHHGTVENGKFSPTQGMPYGIVGTPQDGFLVRKIPVLGSGQVYALQSVTADRVYSASCGQSILAFSVRPREIQYITTVLVSRVGDRVRIGQRQDLAAAVEYLKKRYPGVALPVTEGHFEFVEQTHCPSSSSVPTTIYLPARR